MKSNNYWDNRQRSKGRQLHHRLYENKRRYKLLKGKKILDVGSGAGEFLMACPRDVKVSGIDITNSLVAMTKKDGFEVCRASATHLPFKDETFDGAHCSFVIQVLRENEADSMLREIRRILKSNSRIFIDSPMPPRPMGPHDVKLYDLETLKELFSLAGFKLICHEKWRYFRGLGLLPQPFFNILQRFFGYLDPQVISVLGEKTDENSYIGVNSGHGRRNRDPDV